MLLQGDELGISAQIPHLDGPIGASRDQDLAIWRKCHRLDSLQVPLTRDLFLPRGCIPELYGTVLTCGGQALAIGSKPNGRDRPSVACQRTSPRSPCGT